jgi:hypothetical protein
MRRIALQRIAEIVPRHCPSERYAFARAPAAPPHRLRRRGAARRPSPSELVQHSTFSGFLEGPIASSFRAA